MSHKPRASGMTSQRRDDLAAMVLRAMARCADRRGRRSEHSDSDFRKANESHDAPEVKSYPEWNDD